MKMMELLSFKTLHKLLHRDTLIYEGWIPHLCFSSEITISFLHLSHNEKITFLIN